MTGRTTSTSAPITCSTSRFRDDRRCGARRSPLGIPVGAPVAEVVAVAKRDLKAGERIDGIGGFCLLWPRRRRRGDRGVAADRTVRARHAWWPMYPRTSRSPWRPWSSMRTPRSCASGASRTSWWRLAGPDLPGGLAARPLLVELGEVPVGVHPEPVAVVGKHRQLALARELLQGSRSKKSRGRRSASQELSLEDEEPAVHEPLGQRGLLVELE